MDTNQPTIYIQLYLLSLCIIFVQQFITQKQHTLFTKNLVQKMDANILTHY